MLPALLGDLTLQTSEGDRMEVIQKARVYLVDYLQRCKSYTITTEVAKTRDHLGEGQFVSRGFLYRTHPSDMTTPLLPRVLPRPPGRRMTKYLLNGLPG